MLFVEAEAVKLNKVDLLLSLILAILPVVAIAVVTVAGTEISS